MYRLIMILFLTFNAYANYGPITEFNTSYNSLKIHSSAGSYKIRKGKYMKVWIYFDMQSHDPTFSVAFPEVTEKTLLLKGIISLDQEFKDKPAVIVGDKSIKVKVSGKNEGIDTSINFIYKGKEFNVKFKIGPH
jgi:hypothetical protein